MNILPRKTVFTDLADWFEEPLLPLRSYLAQPIRVEEYAQDSRYLIKAELPGIDPAKDVEVTVGSGCMMIHTERSCKLEGKRRSEFRYGSFTRSLTLPPNAVEDDVTASYDAGILTVSIGLKEEKEAARKIEVSVGE